MSAGNGLPTYTLPPSDDLSPSGFTPPESPVSRQYSGGSPRPPSWADQSNQADPDATRIESPRDEPTRVAPPRSEPTRVEPPPAEPARFEAARSGPVRQEQSWTGPKPTAQPDQTQPFGVGASGGTRQPFGPAVTRNTGAPSYPPGFDPNAPLQVPGQYGPGTVYGGAGNQSPIDMTMPVSMPMENSGSLTGHILAQGWDHGPDTNRRSNAKVAVAMLIVLLVLIGASLLFLLTFGSDFSKWLNGIFGG